MKSELIERNKNIAIDILNGETMKVVAGRYHVTPERTRQITCKMTRIVDKELCAESFGTQRSPSIVFLRKNKSLLITKINNYLF